MSETMNKPSTLGWTQAGRELAVETPLGADSLLLTSFVGEEAISELYSYELVMLSADHAIPAERLIGSTIKVMIGLQDGTTTPIHGMVAQFRAGPLVGREELRQYSARIVPWLWCLGQTTDCRIYQNLNVPDIIEQVFDTYGFNDYEMSVTKSDYPKREFCVQYRETALNFVSRLMEDIGVFYYFRQEADRHVLVIADSNVGFRPLPDKQLTYEPANPRFGHVRRWEHAYHFRPGRWAQKDFGFETPSTDLTTTEKTVLKIPKANAFERYNYPGGYVDKTLGSKLTRTLMEAEEAAYHLVRGTSAYPSLAAGGKFSLSRHPCEDDGQVYVVRRVRHEATCTGYLEQHDVPSRYENIFEAVPYDVKFRPLRTTERPFVHGPQTAIVVGPSGEKIFTDKYGRVRVQFHWDRYGTHDDKSSCWIRVSNAWAGSGWGNVNLPHVGQEVVVSFLEGDPDRPLITGRVYNGENRKAIDLPANKTQSAIRDHAGNEILMEGKQGSEDIRTHAVKDMNTTVDNDSNTIVHGKYTHDVTKATANYHVKGALTEIYDSTQATTVKSDLTIVSPEGAIAVSSDSKHVYINAGTNIQLHVGQSMIWMDKGGQIRIQGVDISIAGSSSVTIKGGIVHSEADSEHQTKGAIVLSEGSATNTVKGGMVMLNP